MYYYKKKPKKINPKKTKPKKNKKIKPKKINYYIPYIRSYSLIFAYIRLYLLLLAKCRKVRSFSCKVPKEVRNK